MTTNATLLTLSNRILELEKTLKEKDGIIQKTRNKNQHITTKRKTVSSRNKWCKKGK